MKRPTISRISCGLRGTPTISIASSNACDTACQKQSPVTPLTRILAPGGTPCVALSSVCILAHTPNPAVDRLDDGMQGRPWLPCPLTGWAAWCAKFHDIWATSIIFHGSATQLYDPWGGGLVLSPAVRLNCGYPAGMRPRPRPATQLHSACAFLSPSHGLACTRRHHDPTTLRRRTTPHSRYTHVRARH